MEVGGGARARGRPEVEEEGQDGGGDGLFRGSFGGVKGRAGASASSPAGKPVLAGDIPLAGRADRSTRGARPPRPDAAEPPERLRRPGLGSLEPETERGWAPRRSQRKGRKEKTRDGRGRVGLVPSSR